VQKAVLTRATPEETAADIATTRGVHEVSGWQAVHGRRESEHGTEHGTHCKLINYAMISSSLLLTPSSLIRNHNVRSQAENIKYVYALMFSREPKYKNGVCVRFQWNCFPLRVSQMS
jgi:hypothetical protein